MVLTVTRFSSILVEKQSQQIDCTLYSAEQICTLGGRHYRQEEQRGGSTNSYQDKKRHDICVCRLMYIEYKQTGKYSKQKAQRNRQSLRTFAVSLVDSHRAHLLVRPHLVWLPTAAYLLCFDSFYTVGSFDSLVNY